MSRKSRQPQGTPEQKGSVFREQDRQGPAKTEPRWPFIHGGRVGGDQGLSPTAFVRGGVLTFTKICDGHQGGPDQTGSGSVLVWLADFLTLTYRVYGAHASSLERERAWSHQIAETQKTEASPGRNSWWPSRLITGVTGT